MNSEIGQILRKRRLELRLSMKQVAIACGVSEATVSRWETGETDKIQRGSIYLLSKTLHLPIEIIVGVDSNHVITPSEVIVARRKLYDKLDSLSVEQLESVDKFVNNFVVSSKGEK